MNKMKALKWAVVALFALNVLTIAALILGRPGGLMGPKGFDKRKGGPNPGRVLAEKLGFDREQEEALHELIKEHSSNITQKERELNETRTRMFALLTTGDYESRSHMIEEIATIQQDIEEVHFQHFLAVKKLCREEQLPAFYELARQLKIGNPGPPPHKGPPR